MQNKRRQYITHKSYQRGIVLWIILICAIGLLINLGIFNFFSYKEVESLRWRMHIPVDTIGDIVGRYLIYSTIPVVIIVVTALLIFFRHIIKKTDRMLYGLKKDIDNIADGDLSFNVSLNKSDDFKELSDGCNRMVGSLRDKFSVLKVKMHGINETLEGLEHVKDKQLFDQKTRMFIETFERLKKEV
ncbi:MAG: methyl-accepting chemotaxis protein [Nitrospirae bacterium]|nr:methyl-accepting chemotaxis protein [Nitrospirota bacterium]